MDQRHDIRPVHYLASIVGERHKIILPTLFCMDFARFTEWRWRVLFGIVNAGLALGVIFLPYISVGKQYYIYDLPGDWWHVGVFIFAAICALAAIKSFSFDFVLPIIGGIGVAIDLTFALGVVFLGINPNWSLVNASVHVGGILSVGVMFLLLAQGYIWLQLRSEDFCGEKPALKETNAAPLEKSP